MTVKQIHDPRQKSAIARAILEALPEWFEIPETREQYIQSAKEQPFFAAYEKETPIGFLCLKQTGKATVELAVMGVLKPYQHSGAGSALFEAAKEEAIRMGYSFMQVKTVQLGKYPEYDATNRFYLHLGFQEFECFPLLWDENNPCQIYVMALK